MSYFLEAILPSQGTYFVVAIKNGKVKQVHASSFEEIEAFAAKAPTVGVDAYFAVASFKDATSRKAENAELKKAFYLDIDCGPNKDYPDIATASAELRKFLEATKLPDPMVVSSGYGLHVYWPLDEAIPTESWTPVAKALKQLCVDHDFRVDPSVTSDSARILRIPGTKNFKNGDCRDVTIVQHAPEVRFVDFAKRMPVAPSTSFLADARKLTFGADDVGATLAGPMPTWNFRRIADKSLDGHGCNQIKYAIENAHALPEPLWRAALSVAWCCEDKEDAIQWISQSHPQYSAAATLEKARQTNGAWHCDTYKQHFPQHCEGCKHTCSSPLNFGKIVHAAKAEDGVYKVESIVRMDEGIEEKVAADIPEYPWPYFRGAAGGVFRRKKDEDGNDVEVQIFQHDLYIAGRSYDSEQHGEGAGELYTIRLHLPHDGVRNITLSAADILSKEKLVQGLAKEGAFLYGKEHVEGVMGYLVTSMRKLQDKDKAAFTRNQMGWTPGNKSFVIGDLEYSADGVRLAPPCSGTRQLADYFRPKGSLEEWKKAVNFYAQSGQEAKALALFIAMGAPLMSMFDSATIRGAVVNLISTESGTGKTTALLVCNSIWGKPDSLLLQQEDTYLAKFQRLGMFNSLAVTVDELTTMQDKECGNFIFGATKGRPRHRMESQSNKLRANNTSWCLPVICSSNRSIVDILQAQQDAADGELRRLIEIYVHPTQTEKTVVDEIFRKIVHNYGHAGVLFIQYVLKHYDEVQQQLLKLQTKIDEDLKLGTAERYHSALLAMGFLAAMLCQKLGIWDIDYRPVYKWTLDLMHGIKEQIAPPPKMEAANVESAMAALASYIAENVAGVLAVRSTQGSGGIMEAPAILPRGPLRYRYETDTKLIWVPTKDFNAFLTDRRLNTTQTLKALVESGVMRTWAEKGSTAYTRPKRAASGMVANMAVPSVRCYCFDGDKIAGLPDALQDPAHS